MEGDAGDGHPIPQAACHAVQKGGGSWMAAQGLADKYPAVAELAGQATHLAGLTKRIFVLYVEGDGLIPPAGDLVEGIWFGADVKGGCVELSDRTGAGMGFLEVLKEAVPSGNVSVAHMESRWMEGLKAKWRWH